MKEKIKVLVVDNLEENHLAHESVLTDTELYIINAITGKEALSLCLIHDFAVILFNVEMPDVDAFETAELLRSIEKTQNIPLIFVTNIREEQKSIFKGYEVASIDYLFKPIDLIVLRSKVDVFKKLFIQRRLIDKQAEQLQNQLAALNRIQEERDFLECISIEDMLTKVYNRRGLEKMLNMHWKTCSRHNFAISIMLFDLDNFKNYNDNYSHYKGDEVLKAVSRVTENSLFRVGDFVCRYGGEEFLAVLPNTNIEGALKVAERLRKNVLELNITHEYNMDFGKVTISIGVASVYPKKNSNPETLIKIADQMMYKAKHSGRNCIRHKSI